MEYSSWRQVILSLTLPAGKLLDDTWFGMRLGMLRAAYQLLDRFQDVEKSLHWANDLNGAFRPVSPTCKLPLVVRSGKLPTDLSGVFLRVGPNPAHWPPKKCTHIFDGDGMVHSVRIDGGEAMYSCAFMETERWKVEQQLGSEWFVRLGEIQGWSGLAKILLNGLSNNKLTGLRTYETSTANTAVAFTPDGRLWALNESGFPFRFQLDKSGCPKSLGFDTLKGSLKENMSAHPKFDQRTGETFFHGFTPGGGDFYVGRIFDGEVTDRVELPVPDGFHHDLFITENYVVVVDGSMTFEPNSVVEGGPLWNFTSQRKLRFGVWPRSAGKMTAESFTWIEAEEAAEIVHTLHAYEEDGKIVLWAPLGRELKGSTSMVLGDIGPCRMHQVTIDIAQTSVQIQEVIGSDLLTEFPRIRDDGVGRRVRHGYSAVQGGDGDFDFVGIAKWDFEACGLESVIRFPTGVLGGEPIFIPSAQSTTPDDDCGYIGMFLWHTELAKSTFVLYDAQTMSPQPVAELEMPRRVPMGFHARWVSEDEFDLQATQDR
jgi:carotenoid cleavage dioxygenase